MDFTSLFTGGNVLGLGVVGYIFYALKDIPGKLSKYFNQHICVSFSATTQNELIYKELSEYIFSLDSKSLKNHINIEKDESSNDEGRNQFYALNYGTYYVYKFPFTFIIIDKQQSKDKNNLTNQIDIKIFGNSEVEKNKILTRFKVVLESDKLLVYPFRWMNNFKRIEKRSFDSLFLNNGDKEKIIKTIETWQLSKTKERYVNVGITYKLGILLYGIPGTGKSSLAKAIASKYNWPLHVINLNTFDDEEDFVSRVSQIGKNSIILLEDIDAYGATHKRKKAEADNSLSRRDSSVISLTSILNVLDGIMSPQDAIFIATTNHFDKLDEALFRDGRFDVKMELKNLDYETAKSMCEYHKASLSLLEDIPFPVNPATLQRKIFEEIKFS